MANTDVKKIRFVPLGRLKSMFLGNTLLTMGIRKQPRGNDLTRSQAGSFIGPSMA